MTCCDHQTSRCQASWGPLVIFPLVGNGSWETSGLLKPEGKEVSVIDRVGDGGDCDILTTCG